MSTHTCDGASCVVCDPVGGRPTMDSVDRVRLAILEKNRRTREIAGASALMSYLYAVRSREVVTRLFGADSHPDYLDEKTALLIRGVHYLWAALDRENRARLVEQAVTYIGAEGPRAQADAHQRDALAQALAETVRAYEEMQHAMLRLGLALSLAQKARP